MDSTDVNTPPSSVFNAGAAIREWMDTCLDNHERVELLFGLLNTMTNLEVRYFHNVFHSFMNREWQTMVESQELTRRTNDILGLKEQYEKMDPQLLFTKEITRNQLILNLSALHPLNTACAEIIGEYLDRSKLTVIVGSLKEEQLITELLMVATMAFRHPAFRFHQRIRLGHLVTNLTNRLADIKFNVKKRHLTGNEEDDPNLVLPDPEERDIQMVDASTSTSEFSGISLWNKVIPTVTSPAVKGQSRSEILTTKEPLVYLRDKKPRSFSCSFDLNCTESSAGANATPAQAVVGMGTARSAFSNHGSHPRGITGSSSRGSGSAHNDESTWWRGAKKPPRLKSCYNCGRSGHWGQNCRDRPRWREEDCQTNPSIENEQTFYPTSQPSQQWDPT